MAYRSKMEIQFAPSIMEELFDSGYSCSETTFRTLCQVFDVSFNITMLRATSSFRGGANVGWICGILSSSLAFLPLLEKRLSQAGYSGIQVEALAAKLSQEFISKFDAYDCTTIWKRVSGHGYDFPENQKAHCIDIEGVSTVIRVIDDFLKANSI